ncbi:hypothetical protein GCM10023322_09600 [Rugosimonospora acidiphila]|uniref:Uncharacterized protein n=1 Tax=Rugosimonospora acidiphila TaxID=556531 RepID=A0ABP9RLZ1_9ACTN
MNERSVPKVSDALAIPLRSAPSGTSRRPDPNVTVRVIAVLPPAEYRDHPRDLSVHCTTDQTKVAVPVTPWESFAVTVTV